MNVLGSIVLPDQDGNEVRLGDLGRERPTALVWLRHYGWTFCRAHAVQLDRARQDFDAAAVELVLIGQGDHRQAAHFRRRQGIELPVLADEQRASYKAIGAKMGSVSDLLGPAVVAKGALTTLKTGKLQGRTVGNPAQLGAAAVIADGEIVWTHIAKDAGDNVTPEDLLTHI